MSQNFKLNLKGLNQLMKGPEMAAVLNTAADAVAAAAGDGFGVERSHPLTFDGIASVFAETYEARKACREDDVLKPAVEGVRI